MRTFMDPPANNPHDNSRGSTGDCQPEIVEVKPVNGAGNLKAFVTVRLGSITVKKFRIVQQPGQKAWLSVPQDEWKTPAGERRWTNLVELPRELKARIEELAIAAWEGIADESPRPTKPEGEKGGGDGELPF